jgi:signal transduction histidine kinase
MAANTHKFPFRPRARLLQILGDQLIGSPRLAVFELVKNAYDADADTVTVTLEDIDSADRTIIVEDDGEGMSLETIRDIWLVPAHDHRGNQRKALQRTKKARLPLGEKGVGRFAVHKLGDRIELVTKTKGSDECVVTIDWDTQIGKKYLSDTEVLVRTRAPEVFKGRHTGTKLTISRLREEAGWSRGEVRRLLRQITSISSPFAERSDDFRTVLSVPDHPEWVTGLPDIPALLERAPWHFKFKFENGLLDWKYEFRGVSGIKLASRTEAKKKQHLLIPPERDLDVYGTDQGSKVKRTGAVADASMTDGIGPITGEFYVFDRDREVLMHLGDGQLIKSFLDENGGVRVYRDNIRVYNYGEPGDDWLELDLARVNTPTRNISRNIVIGAVDLSLALSTGLMEKTNREGFVENAAYRNLKRIILGGLSLLQIERKIDKDKIRALTGKGKDRESEFILEPLQKLREAAKKHRLEKELNPLIDKAETNYNEMRDTMLRAGLSGMGLAVVFHEVERGVRVLHDAIEAGGKSETIQVQARELVRILDGFTELLRKGDRKPNSLKHLIRRVRDINQVRFRYHNVKLLCPALEETEADIQMTFSFGLVLGALNNLLDNAFYWLQVRWPEKTSTTRREIYINFERDYSGRPAIVVADNGPGFQDDPDRLTRPFFSRRPDGMGIGLYYTNMVMELNGGQLAFPEPDDVDVPARFDGAVLALAFGRGDER